MQGEDAMDVASRRTAGALLLISVLLLAPLTLSSSAEVAPNGLEMIIEIDEPDNGLYYSNEAPLEVTIKIRNHADVSREIQYNPACAFDLVISNDDWSLDLDDERICPSLNRAFAIQPGQTRVLDTWEWDWANAPSGTLTLEFEQPDAELSADRTIDYHSSMDMPESLEMKVLLGQTVGSEIGHTDDMPAMTKVSLLNTGLSDIQIPFDSNCRVQMTVEDIVDTLTTLNCGHGIIKSGEEITLGWTNWDFDGAEDGEYSIEFRMTGVRGASAIVDTALSHALGILSQESVVPTVTTTITENMEWYYTLQNQDDVPNKLRFSDSCTTQMHVLSPMGEIVYDTRNEINCVPTGGSQFTLAPLETYIMATGSWDFRDSEGCEIDDGLHLLVVTQPDNALVATHAFTYEGEGSGEICRAANQHQANVHFTVNEMEILEPGSLNEQMVFNLQLDNLGDEQFNLYWPTDCALEIMLSRSIGDEQDVRQVWSADCSLITGQTITMESRQSHEWADISIPFVIDGEPIENGTWLVTVQTTSIPAFVTQAAHTYNGLQISEYFTLEPAPDVVVETTDIVVENNSPFFEISGDWHYVTQPKQGCWLLSDSNGNEWSFIANMKDAGWKPQPGMTGSYDVEKENAIGDCSAWPGIVILSTIDESTPEITAEPPEIVVSESSESPTEVVIENAPTAAAVVATTSLSIMILLYIGNTEWIRIPALQIGIGLVGMVRRTREHDGEYQRGRIMGYLTANPGVHFRALLGALQMSNGQLTHHLKNLQGEERIWRRKDGRLVRFYPASIQSNTDEDDLPVPLLTPDPNSLQGKILRLLDATENDIVNLSQKELAHRLEASQQLVSHHLRTLQKFGLIEREKVGMRYRYQLTREAIFLVNSSEFTVDTE